MSQFHNGRLSVRRAGGVTRGMLVATMAGVAGVTGAFATRASAATNYFWDPGASASGTGSGGSGTWDTSSLNWYPGTGSTDVVWPNTTSYNASFGGTSPGTVTLNTNIITDNLTFATSGYTINTSTNTLSVSAAGIAITPTAGTATITGTGALTLTGAQTWTGVAGGLLSISAPITDSGGQLSLATSGATFNFSGGGSFATGINFVPGTGTITNLTAGSYTSAALLANGGTFTVNTGSTLTLTTTTSSAQSPGFRNNANQSSLVLNGGTIVSDGVITIAHGAAVGTITLNSGELDVTYGIGTDSGSNQGTINFAGATVKLLGSLSDLANASGTTNSGAAITMNDVGGGGGAVINTNGFSLGLAENILHTTGNGSPDGGITKLGLGTLTLSGASSTYNGGVNISQGTIMASSKAALGAATATIGLSFTPASGNTATVDFNSATGTIASLSNSGLGTSSLVLGNTAPTSGSASVLTIGNANVSSSLNTTFSGVISDLSGTKSGATGQIVKTGSSTLILSGSNTFTGGVELFSNNAGSGNNGILIPMTNSAFGTGSIQSDMSGGSELGQIQLTGGISLSNSITAATRTISVTIANPNFLNTAGNNTLNGNISTGSGGTAFGLASNGGILTVNGSYTNTAGTVRTLDLSGSASGVFNGVIYNTGNGAIVEKDGSGTWALSNINSYQGGTTVNDGTLTGSTGSFGSGSVTVSPNGVTATSADNATLNSNGSIGSLAAVTVSSETSDGGFGIGQINFNSTAPVIGSLAGNGSVVLANAGGTTLTTGGAGTNTVFSGNITDTSGSSSLIKAGSGSFNLSGANSYGGMTVVSAGTLVAGSLNALPSTTAVNISGGTLDVSAFNSTIGSLVISSAGTLNLGAGSILTVTGSATLNGTLNLIGTPGTLPETLMTYASETGMFASFVPPTGDKLLYGLTSLQLVVSGPSSLVWTNASATGQWNTTDINWNNGTGAVAYSDTSNGSSGDIVTFTNITAGSSSYNVTVSGTVHPTSTTFTNTAGNNYNISGGTISGPGPLTLNGGGTVTLSGNNNYSGGTNVAAGTLVLASANAFPSGVSNAGTGLTVGSGATVQIANHGGGTTVVPFVSSLTNNGTIDITNNALVLKGAGASIGTISNQVAAAYNNGAWNGAGGSIGAITSSVAAADSTHLTAVGVATGLTSFEGGTVSASDVLLKYTYYGDANLDGQVDGTDYSRIDNGVLMGLTGWYNGDFNYDGVINGSDYTLIDNAFNTQGANIQSQFASPTAQIAGGSGISAVPEPTTLGLLGIGAVGLLGRRRRR